MLTIMIALAITIPHHVVPAMPRVTEEAPTWEDETGPYVDESPLGDPGVWYCFTEGAPGDCLVEHRCDVAGECIDLTIDNMSGDESPSWDVGKLAQDDCAQW